MLIQDVALKTYREWWTIKTGCERESGRSVLTVWHDIYIYIYILSSTDRQFRCITTLQLTKHTGGFKLGSKPAKLYSRLDIFLLSHFDDIRQLRNLTHFVLTFVCLHFTQSDTGVLNSLEELCNTQVAAVYSFARVYIVSQFFSVARHAGSLKLGSKNVYICIYILLTCPS